MQSPILPIFELSISNTMCFLLSIMPGIYLCSCVAIVGSFTLPMSISRCVYTTFLIYYSLGGCFELLQFFALFWKYLAILKNS